MMKNKTIGQGVANMLLAVGIFAFVVLLTGLPVGLTRLLG
ncbi:hypothetical protein EDD73_101183 [Heliophilum fasciatum]|uniref:Uncharacterized protein n=1 Tax=Heliophilum fasciatum TaxID=35700 RepID=A0A4R2SD09_9FIRM|nr:hypothetical protein [Heliophilum fasciatum]TCP69015.1 hypothetical protein EDD73_101183 [Heliophilum fasciatum]